MSEKPANLKTQPIVRFLCRIENICTANITRTLLLFCLGYSAISIIIFSRMGFLSSPEEVFFHKSDAFDFRYLADYLGKNGPEPNSYQTSVRPFLYPYLLILYHYIGTPAFMALQWGFNLITLVCSFLSIRMITRSSLLGVAGMLVITLHPTFSFLALHALAETLSMALAASGIYCLIYAQFKSKPSMLFVSAIAFAFATSAKPVYLVFFLCFVVYIIVKQWTRHQSLMKTFGLPALAFVPIIYQVHYYHGMNDRWGFSDAGSHNFKRRFYVNVYSYAHEQGFKTRHTPIGQEALKANESMGDKLKYTLSHPWITMKVISVTTYRNITDVSTYTEHPKTLLRDEPLGKALTYWSGKLNKRMLIVHGLGAVGLIYLIGFRPRRLLKTAIPPLVILNYSLIFLSALSYYQGDRLTIIAVPVFMVLYPYIFRELFFPTAENPSKPQIADRLKRSKLTPSANAPSGA